MMVDYARRRMIPRTARAAEKAARLAAKGLTVAQVAERMMISAGWASTLLSLHRAHAKHIERAQP